MLAQSKRGLTIGQIAEKLDVSRQRAHFIVKSLGLVAVGQRVGFPGKPAKIYASAMDYTIAVNGAN